MVTTNGGIAMFTAENKLTLAEAAKLAPGRPHISAIWRYCRKGVRAATGRRIYLEYIRFGARLYTSSEALSRFGERLAAEDAKHFARDGDRESMPRAPSARKRHREIAKAEASLTAAGV